MIPRVKTWKVSYYGLGILIASTTVDTINKRFARWMAVEKIGYPTPLVDKITIGLIRKGGQVT